MARPQTAGQRRASQQGVGVLVRVCSGQVGEPTLQHSTISLAPCPDLPADEALAPQVGDEVDRPTPAGGAQSSGRGTLHSNLMNSGLTRRAGVWPAAM